MLINRFKEIKRFLSLYKIEEHIFHIACNNFKYDILSVGKNPSKEFSLRNFNMVIKGRIKIFYEKQNQKSKYENFFISNRKDILKKENKDLLNYSEKNEILERVLSEGEIFTKKNNYKGFKIKDYELLDDCEIIFLNEEIYEKIFENNLMKYQKIIKNFILKTMNFKGMTPKSYEHFEKRIDIMVTNVL